MYFEWLILIITNPEWVTAIGTVFLGFMTLLAIVVALFKEDIIKPKIKVGFGNVTPYTIDNFLTAMGRLFRIKIVNEGKTVARNCQIKLLSVKSEEGINVLEKNEPDVLKWSGAPKDTRYQSRGVMGLVSIDREKKDITPKGGWEFCDLFWIDEKKELIFYSAGRRKFICEEGKRYFAVIEISGDNFEPTRKEIKIYTPLKVNFEENDITFLIA
ncbi:MAG: hypothetical protein KKB31_04015, partial [Nanoarchaeota archaeon]|nr:hypothetical protein [Nanoarchaeota archaeon]